MRVLRNNLLNKVETESNYPKKVECNDCGSELEYDHDDMHVGYLGSKYITCPVCGNEHYLNDEESLDITVENIEFPTHFYHFGDIENAKDCPSSKIKKLISEAIEYFRSNKNEFAYFTDSGNTMVDVFNMSDDEEYVIRVAKNYYEGCIPYEECDYAE